MSTDSGKESRHNRLVRYLLTSNEQNAYSITDFYQRLINDGFKITRKTVERDISELSLKHPGLHEVEGRPSRFYFEKGYQVSYPIDFHEDHLQVIIIALQNLKAMGGPTINSLCKETEDVLLSKLSAHDREDFNKLQIQNSSAITVLGKSQGTQEHTYKKVFSCLQQGKAFLCEYRSPYENAVEERLFHPLVLHFVGGAPYLFVYDSNDKNKIKVLRMSRIEKVKMTEQEVDFSYRKNIDISHAFGAYGTGIEQVLNYKIYCTAPMANKFREQQTHESQVIEHIQQNLYRIEFTLNDSVEIIKYLSQFGESIKKIEPAEVYLKVKEIWKKGLKVA